MCCTKCCTNVLAVPSHQVRVQPLSLAVFICSLFQNNPLLHFVSVCVYLHPCLCTAQPFSSGLRVAAASTLTMLIHRLTCVLTPWRPLQALPPARQPGRLRLVQRRARPDRYAAVEPAGLEWAAAAGPGAHPATADRHHHHRRAHRHLMSVYWCLFWAQAFMKCLPGCASLVMNVIRRLPDWPWLYCCHVCELNMFWHVICDLFLQPRWRSC